MLTLEKNYVVLYLKVPLPRFFFSGKKKKSKQEVADGMFLLQLSSHFNFALMNNTCINVVLFCFKLRRYRRFKNKHYSKNCGHYS